MIEKEFKFYKIKINRTENILKWKIGDIHSSETLISDDELSFTNTTGNREFILGDRVMKNLSKENKYIWNFTLTNLPD